MDIRGVQKCEKCGAEVAAGAAFCMTCGAQIPKIQPNPAVNAGKICKKCGATVGQNARFCTNCGTPYVGKTPVNPVPEVTSQQQVNPVVKEQPQVNVTKKVCTNCGAELQDGVVFCIQCGMPVKKEELAKENAMFENVNPVEQTKEETSKNVSLEKMVSVHSEHTEQTLQEELEKQWKNPTKNVCLNCGMTLADNVRFCINCGEEVRKADETAEEATMRVNPITLKKTDEVQTLKRSRFCIGCGAKLDDDSVFCTECGRRVE